MDVLDKEKIKSSHFVGISLGTILIRQIAETYPKRIKSMVMAGAIMKLNVRSQIDQDVLESAIEALANAKRVEVYAFGGSAPVAMDAQHKFFRLKISSSFISDPHIQLMSANSLSKDDVVLAISQSGTTSALIDSVKIVRKSGVKVIGIMPENSPLANICDYPISINVGDNYRITKPHTSRIAYTAVIDVMTMGIAQLKPEAQEHLYNIVDSQRSLKIK